MECRRPDARRRRRRLLACLFSVLLLVSVGALLLALTLRHDAPPPPLRDTFLDRCAKFKGYDCQKLWSFFLQAFVGRDPCQVPMDAYDALMAAAAPASPACNRMMFWSKTKDLVHELTEQSDCFVTLEDSVLGAALDGLTWCGEEGSNETFTTGCPGWTECDNNPVRSFWNRASAAFADAACGDVSALLNGSIATPFSPTSIFATIEVKRFNSTRMRSLNVVLASQPNSGGNCTNASLKDLQKELDPGIKYNCKEVPVSKIKECGTDPEKPCGSCW